MLLCSTRRILKIYYDVKHILLAKSIGVFEDKTNGFIRVFCFPVIYIDLQQKEKKMTKGKKTTSEYGYKRYSFVEQSIIDLY